MSRHQRGDRSALPVGAGTVVPEAPGHMSRETDRAYLKRPVGDTATLPSKRSLAVLIVAGDHHDLLDACLGGVAEHLPEFPVYVYGHAESATKYPAVHRVSGPENIGFAASCNVLVEHAPADADLLLLNADTRLLGPLTRTRALLGRPHIAAVSPMARGTAPGRTPDVDHSCLAINRAAWNTLGGFDEEFFGYGAATDWRARARAQGWRVVLADELGVDRPAIGEKTVSPGERRRSHDLARADTALLLEHQRGVHHADAYLAGAAVWERARGRAVRRPPATELPAIVITTNRLVYGGAERQKALLATELDRRGYPVTIVCVQRFGPLISEIPETVRVVRQPWWAPNVDIPPGPAVVITGDTNTETGFGSLWRAAGRKRRWLVAPHVPPEADRPIYSRPLTAAMRRADGLIVLAQRHWDMLAAQHRLRGRRFVAPNGVAHIGEPAPRLRTAGEPVHMVMLSRIVEHKNPHLLIEALSELGGIPWKLSIFGDGPDRERLQARTPAALGDRVQWRGWSPGPGPALADADLLCVPSRSEAFPVVILEAMSRAVPVAASAICAVPEMLDFGRAGFLVEPVSVSGWREQLARILADPDQLPSVGRRGYERMRTHYTVQAMTDAYLDAIGAVL